MKKGIYTLALTFLVVTAVSAQTTVLANFDFNSGSSYPIAAASTATNITASINGTETDAAYSGSATGSNAFVQNTTAGNALSMSNSSGTNSQYWTLTLGGSALNTYQAYKIYFQTEHSSTGATVITISYSIDGSTYTALSQTVAPGLNNTFTEANVDLSSITALNGASAIYLQFAASGASSTGTLRIDNLQIQGSTSPFETNGSSTTFNGAVTAPTLTVTGSARINGAFTSGATTVSSLTNSGNLNVTGTTALIGAVSTGALSSGATTVSSLSSGGNVSATGNLTTAGTFAATGAATLSNNLSVAGTTNLTGAVTTGALTSGATTVSSLNSNGNISTSGVLSAATLSVTGGANFDSLNIGQNLSFGGGKASLGFIPASAATHSANVTYLSRNGNPNTLPVNTCLFPQANSNYLALPYDYLQLNSTWNSSNSQINLGYDGANNIFEGQGTNSTHGLADLLINYYCGSDVAICVNATNGGGSNANGGVVSVGQNFQIGGPISNYNTALNLKTNGTMTRAMNLANSSNTSIFSVATTGDVTMYTGSQLLIKGGDLNHGLGI